MLEFSRGPFLVSVTRENHRQKVRIFVTLTRDTLCHNSRFKPEDFLYWDKTTLWRLTVNATYKSNEIKP